MQVCFKFMLTEHLAKTCEVVTLALLEWRVGVELLHHRVATQRASFSGTFRTEMKGARHGTAGLNTLCRCIPGPLPGCLYGSFWQQCICLACIHFYRGVNNLLRLYRWAQEKSCMHTTVSSSFMLEQADRWVLLEGKVWDLKRMGGKYRASASTRFCLLPWEYSEWKHLYRCENKSPQAGREGLESSLTGCQQPEFFSAQPGQGLAYQLEVYITR